MCQAQTRFVFHLYKKFSVIRVKPTLCLCVCVWWGGVTGADPDIRIVCDGYDPDRCGVSGREEGIPAGRGASWRQYDSGHTWRGYRVLNV